MGRQLQIQLQVPAEALEAVEEVLENAGAQAQTLLSGDETELLEPGVGEHPLWSVLWITALFPSETDPEVVKSVVREALDGDPDGWRVEWLEDRPWERAWLDDFHPLRFGRRLWIVPGGRQPSLPAGAVPVYLDPGLAFGTGTHETTALCLEWLDGQRLADCTVLDYGSGSGVLSVAAAKLGASRVVAVDNDPQARLATAENAARNSVGDRVRVAAPGEEAIAADYVVANILAGTLVRLAPVLLAGCQSGGAIALSGILQGQEVAVQEAFGDAVEWEAPRQRSDWLLLAGRR